MKALASICLIILVSGCARVEEPKVIAPKQAMMVWVSEGVGNWTVEDKVAWENILAATAEQFCKSDSYMYSTVGIYGHGISKVSITCK